jgi:hypothetical protein
LKFGHFSFQGSYDLDAAVVAIELATILSVGLYANPIVKID